MILISGIDIDQITPAQQAQLSQLTGVERNILNQKRNSPVTYRYESIDALQFELRLRNALVDAARGLNASGARFATFKTTRGNPRYWVLEDNGGLRQRGSTLSADAIDDIFNNGNLYAFECATAMVVIMYKAIIETLGRWVFNTYFKDLLLMDWYYDSNLRLNSTNLNETYQGDIVYFKNPDHDPETPEWQGENGVVLGDNLYFGHGMGVRRGEEIVYFLNRKRRPFSMISAYLTDEVVHPNFEYLRRLPMRARPQATGNGDVDVKVFAKIGKRNIVV